MAVWLSTVKLDCRICSDAQKIERGCEKDSPILGVWKLHDWEFQRCPLKLVTRQSFEYIRAYNFLNQFYKWPCREDSGWLEQSDKFIRAIEIIEAELAKIREEEEEKITLKGRPS